MEITYHPLYVQYEGDIEQLRSEFDLLREHTIIRMEVKLQDALAKMEVEEDTRFAEMLRGYLIPES